MTTPLNMTFSRRHAGFTLIEQIMVLAIIAILTSAATPPLRRLMSRNELQVAQSNFIGALQRTREAAIISGKRSVFCPSHDGGSCSDVTRWENGWLVGHDSNGDGQPDHDPLNVGQGHPGKLIIQSSNGRRLVHFRPDGTAGGSNITLLFCQPAHPDAALVVVVSNAGRIRGGHASSNQAQGCASMH
ncbi:GspH/FimT family pseudopilin [Rhodanobacter sp. AS-Z3]|uniref:GspH/FimT family pseudopilin n=1 Tax=Rhodanobacter sp. AS-Z3 TaxID=3031330 RepID=UPI00247A0388|nr:GspH/FimT family pseudopilin [Rhodanobacter sp. AS-Z3]WEN14495.1 GspH/FimT family pseudopilin [Rhodanobacter sp. AS-Z3]